MSGLSEELSSETESFVPSKSEARLSRWATQVPEVWRNFLEKTSLEQAPGESSWNRGTRGIPIWNRTKFQTSQKSLKQEWSERFSRWCWSHGFACWERRACRPDSKWTERSRRWEARRSSAKLCVITLNRNRKRIIFHFIHSIIFLFNKFIQTKLVLSLLFQLLGTSLYVNRTNFWRIFELNKYVFGFWIGIDRRLPCSFISRLRMYWKPPYWTDEKK